MKHMSVFGGLIHPRIASRCPHIHTSDQNLETEAFPPLREHLLNHHISSIVSFMKKRRMSRGDIGFTINRTYVPDRL